VLACSLLQSKQFLENTLMFIFSLYASGLCTQFNFLKCVGAECKKCVVPSKPIFSLEKQDEYVS